MWWRVVSIASGLVLAGSPAPAEPTILVHLLDRGPLPGDPCAVAAAELRTCEGVRVEGDRSPAQWAYIAVTGVESLTFVELNVSFEGGVSPREGSTGNDIEFVYGYSDDGVECWWGFSSEPVPDGSGPNRIVGLAAATAATAVSWGGVKARFTTGEPD